MSTNYHVDLPNSQIHNPKDFAKAHTDSVLIKDSQSSLQWLSRGYDQVTTITTIADVTGLLGGKFFLFKTKTHNYQVWFDVDNTDTIVIGAGFTGVEVDISANDTAATVATALKNCLDALSDVSASLTSSNKVALLIADANKAYPPITPYDVTTGFKFIYSESASTNQYLTTDGSGNIEWTPKPAVVTNTDQSTHFISGYLTHKNTTKIADFFFQIRSQSTGAAYNEAIGTLPGGIDPVVASTFGAYLVPLSCTVKYIQYNLYHSGLSDGSVVFGLLKVDLDEDPSNPTHNLTATSFGAFTGTAKTGENTYGTLAGVPSSLTQWDVLIPYIKSDVVGNTYFSATIHFEN